MARGDKDTSRILGEGIFVGYPHLDDREGKR